MVQEWAQNKNREPGKFYRASEERERQTKCNTTFLSGGLTGYFTPMLASDELTWQEKVVHSKHWHP